MRCSQFVSTFAASLTSKENPYIHYYHGRKNGIGSEYFFIVYYISGQHYAYFSKYKATWIHDTERFEKKKKEFLHYFNEKRMKGMLKLAN